MATNKPLEILTRDQTPNKWSVSLREEVFKKFFAEVNPAVQKLFGDGSLFSPSLFGKYFDPSDAFPLWEFDSESLLANLRSAEKCSVDWVQMHGVYVLKAELLGGIKTTPQVYIDNEKILEISGQWKPQREPKPRDWRSGNWWEHGYVRRLELPDDADPTRIEAFIHNDTFLELKIPKVTLDLDTSSSSM